MDNALSVLPNAGSTEANRTRDKVHEATNKEITETSTLRRQVAFEGPLIR